MCKKVRFARVGAKNAPVYRVVAIDGRKSRDGEPLELLGTVNRRAENQIVHLNSERILELKAQGAQLSDSLVRFLARHNFIEEPPRPETTKQHLPRSEISKPKRKQRKEARKKAAAGVAK